MSLSPQDAAAVLRDIEQTQSRSAILHEYQHAAPHFIIWGIIWIVGYGLSDFFPTREYAIWAALVPVGLVAGAFIQSGGSRASASSPSSRTRNGARHVGSCVRVWVALGRSCLRACPCQE